MTRYMSLPSIYNVGEATVIMEGGVHKAGKGGDHKAGKGGDHKAGKGGDHKAGKGGDHKVGKGGDHCEERIEYVRKRSGISSKPYNILFSKC